MAPCDRKSRRGLRIMDLLKVALIVITFSGVYLFMMVHRIENPFIRRADLSLPLKFTSDLEWLNDSLIEEEVNKRAEFSDILGNDDTFNDLFNFPTDSPKENTSSFQISSQRKSNFRKRRNTSKSRRIFNKRIEFDRREISNSRDVLVSQQKLAPTASRRFSEDHPKSVETKVSYRQSFDSHSDSEQLPETAKSFRRFNNDSQWTGTREKEQQSESLHSSKDDMKKSEQLDPLHLPNDEIKHKEEKLQEQYLPESQTELPQQKTQKLPPSSQANNFKSSKNFTSTLNATNDSKLQEKFHNRSVADSQTVKTNDEPSPKIKYDANLKGSRITEPKQLLSHTRDTILDQVEKTRSELGLHSSKVTSNHPHNKQDSDQLPLPKTSPKKRKSLLIFGDDRSGTTFVTKMFAADPQMFTVYEPLWVTKKWFTTLNSISYSQKVKFTADVVNALLSCQFTRSKAGTKFLAYTSPSWVSYRVFPKNVFRTSPFMKGKTWPNLYQNPNFAEQICLNKFNHSVVKVGQIRVPGESISVLIPRVFQENPDTDIRVIQIVRDPRGSMNSRIKAGWISDFTYTGFPNLMRTMCGKIQSNIEFGRNALKTYGLKERYMEIDYREITSMPITTAKKIYKFAGFEMPDSLIDWIVRSTNPDGNQLQVALSNIYSHVRDSSENNLKWRKESPIKRVRVIEEQCKPLLDLLGLEEVAEQMETLRS